MKVRSSFEIMSEAIEILSEDEIIMNDFVKELGVNFRKASEILEALDQKQMLEKKVMPSFKSNKLCMHYHISLLKETKNATQ